VSSIKHLLCGHAIRIVLMKLAMRTCEDAEMESEMEETDVVKKAKNVEDDEMDRDAERGL
jgi:hypothetical protein